ncbi:uncharacterized protein UV8b_06019 [Ustilaginoidea virens]|uniref:Secreted protein n=1 Tax=Ustilaginoidea virens TaxID=1159556 RepID=A0A8E5HUI0_USTVR|nr:uncharacterized protein UV8b_06019 [Ustilaginoidea virens]QUC21776.1 hypothetical protein UV8b_06019 [Ustilaginoidea virens]
MRVLGLTSLVLLITCSSISIAQNKHDSNAAAAIPPGGEDWINFQPLRKRLEAEATAKNSLDSRSNGLPRPALKNAKSRKRRVRFDEGSIAATSSGNHADIPETKRVRFDEDSIVAASSGNGAKKDAKSCREYSNEAHLRCTSFYWGSDSSDDEPEQKSKSTKINEAGEFCDSPTLPPADRALKIVNPRPALKGSTDTVVVDSDPVEILEEEDIVRKKCPTRNNSPARQAPHEKFFNKIGKRQGWCENTDVCFVQFPELRWHRKNSGLYDTVGFPCDKRYGGSCRKHRGRCFFYPRVDYAVCSGVMSSN